MNLSLKQVTKYFALTLVCFALMAGLGTQAYAVNTTATSTLTVIVAQAVTASADSPTLVLTPANTNFTGNYLNFTTLTFSIRTSAAGVGEQGYIDVKANAEISPATGPLLSHSDLTYTCAAGDLTGGTHLGAPTYCGGGTQTVSTSSSTPVLHAIPKQSYANGAQLKVHWTIPESANYVADTYSVTVTFTVTAT